MFRVLTFLRTFDVLAVKYRGKQLVSLGLDDILALRDELDRHDVDITRSTAYMFESDIWCILSVLKLDKQGKYLYMRYDKGAFKDNSYLRNLSYDRQLASYRGIFNELRGIVVDLEDMRVALLPFPQLYQYGSLDDTMIDEMVTHTRVNDMLFQVSEKIAGHTIYAGIYNNELIAADKNHILDTYEAKALFSDRELHMMSVHRDSTFIYERVISDNHAIVPYDKPGMYLVGKRTCINGELASYSQLKILADNYLVKTATWYPEMTWEEVISRVSTDESAGYVIYMCGTLVVATSKWYNKMRSIVGNPNWESYVIQALADDTYGEYAVCVPSWLYPAVEELRVELEAYASGMNDILVGYMSAYTSFDGSLDSLVSFMVDIPTPLKRLFIGLLSNDLSQGSDVQINWYKPDFRGDTKGYLSLYQIRQFRKEFLDDRK